MNRGGGDDTALRLWLGYLIETAIDWLDALDAAGEDREDDEREIYLAEDGE